MTGAEIGEIIKETSAILTPISVMVVAYFQYRTKERVKEVKVSVDETKNHAEEAKVAATASRAVADDTNAKVDKLGTEINGRMTELIAATNAESFTAGGDAEKLRQKS